MTREAIDSNDEELLVALMDARPALAACRLSRGGDSPLHVAADHGNERLVRVLLDRKARIDETDDSGGQPLHAAAARNRAETARMLIAAGADFQAKGDSGSTPLHEAGGREVAEALLAAGADLRAADTQGLTPLHRAAEYCKDAMVRFLVQRGADLAVEDQWGNTVLHYAACCGGNLAAWLKARGADPTRRNRKGETPDEFCARRMALKSPAPPRASNGFALRIAGTRHWGGPRPFDSAVPRGEALALASPVPEGA